MLQEKIHVQNRRGIHTRAAAKLVDMAKRYVSHIELIHRERRVDAKSIMSVITLGAQRDDLITLIVDGNDEQEAIAAIIALINNKFGEEA